MGKKGICKLAYRVLKTWVPYKTRVLKTLFLRFLFANLDKFLPHRSWVFYTRFQNTQNIEENPAERKKEEEDPQWKRRSIAKKKTHGTNKPSLHQAHPNCRSTMQFTISMGAVHDLQTTVQFTISSSSSIYGAVHDLHGCSSQFVDYNAFTISSSSCMVSAH